MEAFISQNTLVLLTHPGVVQLAVLARLLEVRLTVKSHFLFHVVLFVYEGVQVDCFLEVSHAIIASNACLLFRLPNFTFL